MIITRGGGSKDDLMVFNSEKVVRAIHSLNRPSIVAIGHERDICLSEKAGDVRASTPSNAAELVSDSNDEVIARLSLMQEFVTGYFWQRKSEYNSFKQSVIHLILTNLKNDIYAKKYFCQQIESLILQLLQNVKLSVIQTFNYIFYSTKNLFSDSKSLIVGFNKNTFEIKQQIQVLRYDSKSSWSMIINTLQNSVFQELESLNYQTQKLKWFQPKNILELGYAIVRQDNRIVDNKTKFSSSTMTVLEFRDGEVNL